MWLKMKANSLEELVTNSNIAGELRNYTDWHTRLVKFAQLVADWQKEQMMKDAIKGYVNYYEDSGGILMTEAQVGCPYHNGQKVHIVVLKEEE